MRKLKFIRPHPFGCDILFFDTIGTNWIHHCLPNNCTVQYLDIRHQFPLATSLRFYFRLIKRFFHQNKATPGYRSLIWLSALFDEIKPRIIFTCADTNLSVAHYALEHPETHVIYLQNALRDTIGSMPHTIHLPTYLALGSVEKNIFNSLNIPCSDYRPIGSVKLGIALAQFNESEKNSFDLYFISHYRAELFSSDAPVLFRELEHAHHRLFKNMIDYASAQNLSVGVASKTREFDLQNTELDYFRSIAGEFEFQFIRGDKSIHEFDTYRAGFISNLVVDLSSTLGFELLSAGTKVLFGASQEPHLVTQWGIEHYFETLPDAVKLKSPSKEEFFRTCDRIRRMSDIQYRNLTTDPARAIVTMSETEYPHEAVRRLLSDCLHP
jgi:surface carbohydrate biosynthesis protein